MKIGLCFPYCSKERELTRERMLAWFRYVDEGPFSSITCGERIIGPTVEMSATLAAAAAVTERVGIVPTLYVLPMHSGTWVAKHAATLDVLSGGRVTVTVGVGGRKQDYQAMGTSFGRRQARIAEEVAVMRQVWRGEPPFDGNGTVGPRPVQPGGPPILAGVMGPKSIARAATWADGVYSWSGNGERKELASQLALVRASWTEAGRDRPPRQVAGFWFCLAADAARRLQQYVFDYVSGHGEGLARAYSRLMTRATPDAVREALDICEELGVEECILNPVTRDLAEIENLLEVLAKRR
jgi:alkanesulfonate monooxygenase SsuD/methylene tetrahydromethanopterin reductase-like flavin-dependent oxidoreductase (luciferase family)